MITKKQRKSSRKLNIRSRRRVSQGVRFYHEAEKKLITNHMGRRELRAIARKSQTNDLADQMTWNRKVRLKRLRRAANHIRRAANKLRRSIAA